MIMIIIYDDNADDDNDNMINIIMYPTMFFGAVREIPNT